jgi:membrane-associated phospholipid phosphatase
MKNKFLLSGIFFALFLLLIVAVRSIDVAAIGPEGTSIGFAHVNKTVHDFFGVNLFWYSVTDRPGILAIFTAFVFAVTGFFQWIKRKSIWKVDKEILVLGGLYIVVIGLYVLFENVIINYRPVIMPGYERPEASFPSTHTMIVCVIMGSAVPLIKKYIRNGKGKALLQAFCGLVIGATVIGRLISGVHWFTDILGGILISAALLLFYAGIVEKPD